ncbi:MAG TPA: hypothetical protein VK886_06515 [Vicinamibacterales bacterium]|nr:hypothetical protein [Vicinamibacterales bacterium]
MKLRLVVAATLMTALSQARPSQACFCSASGPPCQHYWAVDVVFAGTVRAIETIDVEMAGGTFPQRLVHFNVAAAYRNAAPGPLDVVTGQGGGDCGYRFEVGKRYLVYAYKREGRLLASICSRTRPIENAQEDLGYIASNPTGAGGARVFGRIAQWLRDPVGETAVEYGPARDVRVYVRGDHWGVELRSDGNGRYNIGNVPPGKYVVGVIPPPQFNQRYLEREIQIADVRACGQEIIGVNITHPPRDEAPYARTFHPTTPDGQRAQVFEVAAGERRDLGTFRLGPPLREHRLNGCVVWPDGAPADASVSVHLAPPSYRHVEGGTRTDASGCFSVRLHEGVSYRILVSASVPGGGYGTAETIVTGAENLQAGRLVLTQRK